MAPCSATHVIYCTPLEIDGAHLVGIGIGPSLVIYHHHVQIPQSKELVEKVHLFLGHVVVLIVLIQLIEAEILGRGGFRAGKDVPAKPPASEMIVRPQLPRILNGLADCRH